MGLPRLQTCCFVLDLKTGNIVLGCLNAFLSFLLMVVMIVCACGVESLSAGEERVVEAAESAGQETDMELGLVDQQAALAGFYAMCIILALMFLAKFAFDVFFVYGVVHDRPGIIKAYFVMWLVFFLLSMFTFSMNLTHYSATTILTELFYIGLNVYAILLSHSFYKQLNEREEV